MVDTVTTVTISGALSGMWLRGVVFIPFSVESGELLAISRVFCPAE